MANEEEDVQFQEAEEQQEEEEEQIPVVPAQAGAPNHPRQVNTAPNPPAPRQANLVIFTCPGDKEFYLWTKAGKQFWSDNIKPIETKFTG